MYLLLATGLNGPLIWTSRGILKFLYSLAKRLASDGKWHVLRQMPETAATQAIQKELSDIFLLHLVENKSGEFSGKGKEGS